MNASDARNKADASARDGIQGSKANMVKEMVTNSLFTRRGAAPVKSVLIMDEVDGMSAGDRGGWSNVPRAAL